MQLALQRQDALGLAVLQAAGSIRTGGNIEPLDAPKVVEELARHTGTATTGTATTGTCISETEVLKRIQTLLEYGLCFGEPSAFHPVAEALQALPSGLDLLEATDDALPPKLEELDAASRRILETLHHSGGVGTTRDAASDADPSKPIPRLIAAGLLKRVDSNTVVLPLRVRALLSGRHMPQIPLHPPATHPDATLEVDTGQSLEVLRQLTTLLEALGEQPIPLLKSGDVGLRSVTQLAKKLDVEERDVVRLISIARAAFLLSEGIPDPYPAEEEGHLDNNYLAPTTLAGVFQDAALHVQWAWVLHCWWNRATVRTWAVRTSAAPNPPN
ncbi:DNA-binding protein, partial [Corynebacterium sp. 732RC1]|nr:DNA-binding protein [Corynebacterium sp. 732RC1]